MRKIDRQEFKSRLAGVFPGNEEIVKQLVKAIPEELLLEEVVEYIKAVHKWRRSEEDKEAGETIDRVFDCLEFVVGFQEMVKQLPLVFNRFDM